MPAPAARDLRALPKAHLHLHFEAAQRPALLRETIERYSLDALPTGDGTFAVFSRAADIVFRSFRRREEYERLLDEMSEDAVAQGAVWLEPAVWISPATVTRMNFSSAEEMLRFLLETAAGAQQKHGVGIGFMMATSRIHPPEDAAELARLAARYSGRGVVSFGLAGDEAAGSAELFREAFLIARAAGLKSTPHAGEHGGPDSVRAALDVLGARRIEHGVRAIEDPALVQRLVDEGICLDVCPTSNVQLNVCQSLGVHPLPALLEAGVKVSLNADDPVIFGCSQLDEYELARREFGLSDAALAEIAATSIRESGAPESLRTDALARIDAWLATEPS